LPRRLLLASLLLIAARATAIDVAPDVKEVKDCMGRNFPKNSSVQSISMNRTVKDGTVKKLRAKIWWQKGNDDLNRARVSFEEPDDIRGSGLLVLQNKDGHNDLFMYLPELRRVRRVTGGMMSGSMFGTDFTYEQIERLEGLSKDAEVTRGKDTILDGAPVYVIEAVPTQTAGETSELTRVVSYVSKETCVAVKTEFYGASDAPTHVMVADPTRITQESSGYVPRRIVMRDLKKGSETELVVDKVEIGVDLPKKHFSQSALEAAGH